MINVLRKAIHLKEGDKIKWNEGISSIAGNVILCANE